MMQDDTLSLLGQGLWLTGTEEEKQQQKLQHQERQIQDLREEVNELKGKKRRKVQGIPVAASCCYALLPIGSLETTRRMMAMNGKIDPTTHCSESMHTEAGAQRSMMQDDTLSLLRLDVQQGVTTVLEQAETLCRDWTGE